MQLASGAAMSASDRARAVEEGSPELKKSIDELTQTLKNQRTAATTGTHYLGSQGRAEAAMRETEEKIQTMRNSYIQASY